MQGHWEVVVGKDGKPKMKIAIQKWKMESTKTKKAKHVESIEQSKNKQTEDAGT